MEFHWKKNSTEQNMGGVQSIISLSWGELQYFHFLPSFSVYMYIYMYIYMLSYDDWIHGWDRQSFSCNHHWSQLLLSKECRPHYGHLALCEETLMGEFSFAIQSKETKTVEPMENYVLICTGRNFACKSTFLIIESINNSHGTLCSPTAIPNDKAGRGVEWKSSTRQDLLRRYGRHSLVTCGVRTMEHSRVYPLLYLPWRLEDHLGPHMESTVGPTSSYHG